MLKDRYKEILGDLELETLSSDFDEKKENTTAHYINMRMTQVTWLWSACLAILGSAYKWYNRKTEFSAFMTKRSYGLYVFHYLPLSASAYLLTKYADLPPVLMYLTVLICGFAGGLILYEIMSRIPFIRWAVLGIKKNKS